MPEPPQKITNSMDGWLKPSPVVRNGIKGCPHWTSSPEMAENKNICFRK